MLALEGAIFDEMRATTVSAAVLTGQGRGASFTQLGWVRERLRALLGEDAWPGTLNLRVTPGSLAAWRALRARPGIVLASPDPGSCNARGYPAHIAGHRALIVVPEVQGYPEDQIEVVASRHLRSELALADGGTVDVLVTEGESDPPARR